MRMCTIRKQQRLRFLQRGILRGKARATKGPGPDSSADRPTKGIAMHTITAHKRMASCLLCIFRIHFTSARVTGTMADEQELQLEFEVTLKKAGIAVPEDRVEALFAGYQDLKRMCALVRQPRDAAAEPSNTYSLVALMKGA